MKKQIIILLSICSVIFSPNASGQQFIDQSVLLTPQIVFGEVPFGTGVSFYDVNNDGLDDLTFPTRDDSVYVYINTSYGFERRAILPPMNFARHALWGDYDNDGDEDIFISVSFGPSKLFRNDGNWTFTDVSVIAGLTGLTSELGAGATWCDVNADGYLDLLQTHNGLGSFGNVLFLGNSTGIFTNASSSWGVSIGSAFSLQASAVDFDFDGDQDIHIANDRPPIDAMLMNQGNFFVNMAQGLGFDVYCNSMSSSPCDFDKDGEYEIMVTNTEYSPHYFWKKNQFGYYEDIAAQQGVHFPRRGWASLWIDANNDSWEDLYIANWAEPEDTQPFFMNISGQLDRQNIIANVQGVYAHSASKGDFNNDGFYDFALTTGDFLSPVLYENVGGENNWFKCKLTGSISNRNGIGTLIEYYINGERNIRYTRSGDSYLSQDSQWQILSLGEALTIDTLRLTWLSGIVDTYYNVSQGLTVELIEGNPTPELQLTVDGMVWQEDTLITLCEGESTHISVTGLPTFVWSNGSIGNTIEVNTPGAYYALGYDIMNNVFISDTILVVDSSAPQTEYSFGNVSCFGASDGWYNFNLINAQEWFVQDLSNNFSIQNLPAGVYTIYLTSYAACTDSLSIVITSPDPMSQLYVIQNDQLQLDIEGGTPPYTIVANGEVITNDVFMLMEGMNVWFIEDQNACSLEGNYFHDKEELSLPGYVVSVDRITINAAPEKQWIVFDTAGRIIQEGNGSAIIPWKFEKGICFVRFLN